MAAFAGRIRGPLRQPIERYCSRTPDPLFDHPPTADDLSRLSYTKAVIEESMRLYPPAWVVERRDLFRSKIWQLKGKAVMVLRDGKIIFSDEN